FRKILLQPLHGLTHLRGGFQRVGAGALRNGQRSGRLVVQQAPQRVGTGAKLDTPNIADARDLSVLGRANDDVAELFFAAQASLRVDQQLKGSTVRARRRSTQHARGYLDVLFANCLNHIRRCQIVRSKLIGVQPDAHAEIPGAENLHVADTGKTVELVFHLEYGEIRKVQRVVAVVRGNQVNHHQQVRRSFLGGNTEALNLFGKSRQSLRYAVLYLHLGFVEVGAETESDRQRHYPIGRSL